MMARGAGIWMAISSRHVSIVTAALSGLAVTAALPGAAWAAGAAYQVDTVEISEPGACKVESWASFAGNKD